MCDYSLAGFRNRLAVEAEELVVYRFPTGTLGLAAPADVETCQRSSRLWWSRAARSKCPTAVCIPPGARLILRDIPRLLQIQLGVGPIEEVTFIQTGVSSGRHRDGIRFRNNQETLLQNLVEGQRAVVRSLSLDSLEEEREADRLEVRTAR
jgi:hypothetical protein